MTQTLMSFIISVSALGYFHLKAFPFHTYLCSYYYANYCLFFICGVCHNVSQFNHRLIWKTLLCFVLPQVGVFENFGCLLNSLIRWQCIKNLLLYLVIQFWKSHKQWSTEMCQMMIWCDQSFTTIFLPTQEVGENMCCTSTVMVWSLRRWPHPHQQCARSH